MLDVVGFGALNLDMIYQIDSLSEISIEGIKLEPGRESSAASDTFSRVLEAVDRKGALQEKSGGGSAANTVVALSRMGFDTGFVGKIGDDKEGAYLRGQMEGVDLRGVVSEGKSGRCLCILDGNRDRSLFLEPNANDTLSTKEVDLRYAANTRFLHLTSFVGENPLLVQKALAGRIGPSTRISLDPGEIYACRGLGDLMPLFQKSEVVFVTDREISMLTAHDSAEGGRRLLELGPSIIVCKRGDKGLQVLTRDRSFALPAPQTAVMDNTGAGDVFNAGFLAGLLMSRPLEECARFAAKIAARSLTGFGRSQYPVKDDLAFFGTKD
jgi:ribokinase